MAIALRRPKPVPFRRLAIVACAGLVAFLALMQGILSSAGYSPCSARTTSPNMQLAATELGIAGMAYLIFLIGAMRLRKGWEIGKPAYITTVVALLISGAIIAALFLNSASCVG